MEPGRLHLGAAAASGAVDAQGGDERLRDARVRLPRLAALSESAFEQFEAIFGELGLSLYDEHLDLEC